MEKLFFLSQPFITSWWFTKTLTKLLSCCLKGKWQDGTSSDGQDSKCLFWLWGGRSFWMMSHWNPCSWICFESFPYDLFELSFSPELCLVLRSSASFSEWHYGRMVIKGDSSITAWGRFSHELPSSHKHSKMRNNSKASSFSSICNMWNVSRTSLTKLLPILLFKTSLLCSSGLYVLLFRIK